VTKSITSIDQILPDRISSPTHPIVRYREFSVDPTYITRPRTTRVARRGIISIVIIIIAMIYIEIRVGKKAGAVVSRIRVYTRRRRQRIPRRVCSAPSSGSVTCRRRGPIKRHVQVSPPPPPTFLLDDRFVKNVIIVVVARARGISCVFSTRGVRCAQRAAIGFSMRTRENK